ncbi:ATP-binding protein [Nocardioides sp. YIM 152588]|uniref:ATP-binding protein n=1 Tax=Nocardioides sp. YIM 152588 TaxID=3158259 RepID=UPI0032E48F2A
MDSHGGAPDGRGTVVELPFVPESVAQARRTVREAGAALPRWLVQDAELLTSELVSNAVLHGAPALNLTIAADEDGLTVAVRDGGAAMPLPARRDVPVGDHGGRGLGIVQRIAQDWGVEQRPQQNGKTVWFRLEARGAVGPEPQEPDRAGTPERAQDRAHEREGTA